MENLARYIIRASFSQERLDYDAQTATVVYKGSRASAKKPATMARWPIFWSRPCREGVSQELGAADPENL